MELEAKIKQVIGDIEAGFVPNELIKYSDYKNQYMYLKNSVVVKICLKSGKEAEIDVTNYFYEKGGNK